MKNGVAKADFFRICYIQTFGGYWFDLGHDLLPDSKYKKYSYPSNCSINVSIFSCNVASDAEITVWSVNGSKPFKVLISL